MCELKIVNGGQKVFTPELFSANEKICRIENCDAVNKRVRKDFARLFHAISISFCALRSTVTEDVFKKTPVLCREAVIIKRREIFSASAPCMEHR